MLQTSINQEFLSLFHHDMVEVELENENKLNLFTLKIQNNRFGYYELAQLLGDNLYHFALSRNEINELVGKGKFNTLVQKAKSRFRNYASNEGELGELLLYCLLESHLKAPKILTKLELKTSNNDYVKGADGVHLLKVDGSNYQLILGESKLEADLGSGIRNAFSSLSNFLDNEKYNYEFDLINSQLVKESYDQEIYELLKKILIPSASDDNNYLDVSFGIFLGFDLDISESEHNLSNSDFRKTIREKVIAAVRDKIDSINKQIRKEEFMGYEFYVYVVPFSEIAIKRKEIIKQLVD